MTDIIILLHHNIIFAYHVQLFDLEVELFVNISQIDTH